MLDEVIAWGGALKTLRTNEGGLTTIILEMENLKNKNRNMIIPDSFVDSKSFSNRIGKRDGYWLLEYITKMSKRVSLLIYLSE
jgi:hypothetical protein